MVVTFLIFSQGDCLFDFLMGVEVLDKKIESSLLGASLHHKSRLDFVLGLSWPVT